MINDDTYYSSCHFNVNFSSYKRDASTKRWLPSKSRSEV